MHHQVIMHSETFYQKEQNVSDTTYSATKDIQTLCKNSASGTKWLAEKGLDLPVVSQCGGHSAPRTHRPTTGAAGIFM